MAMLHSGNSASEMFSIVVPAVSSCSESTTWLMVNTCFFLKVWKLGDQRVPMSPAPSENLKTWKPQTGFPGQKHYIYATALPLLEKGAGSRRPFLGWEKKAEHRKHVPEFLQIGPYVHLPHWLSYSPLLRHSNESCSLIQVYVEWVLLVKS